MPLITSTLKYWKSTLQNIGRNKTRKTLLVYMYHETKLLSRLALFFTLADLRSDSDAPCSRNLSVKARNASCTVCRALSLSPITGSTGKCWRFLYRYEFKYNLLANIARSPLYAGGSLILDGKRVTEFVTFISAFCTLLDPMIAWLLRFVRYRFCGVKEQRT